MSRYPPQSRLFSLPFARQTLSADEDLVHIVKGTVKSVDKDSKTMVVKTADGTEHTIKWTDKTTMEGGKDVG